MIPPRDRFHGGNRNHFADREFDQSQNCATSSNA
jgi:hypothetical protein